VLFQINPQSSNTTKDIEEPEQGSGDREEFLIQTGIHVEHQKADAVGDQGNKINEEKPVSAI